MLRRDILGDADTALCGRLRNSAPAVPNVFPTIVDARQRVMQLALFTRTNDYAADILAYPRAAYTFHSALVKTRKDYDATLKQCSDQVHFAVLLRSSRSKSTTGRTWRTSCAT